LFTSALLVGVTTIGKVCFIPTSYSNRQEFDRYIQHYQTVEVNSTYYRWPPNATFAFLAMAPPPRISDDRKTAPLSNALQASLLARKVVGTHE